MILELFDKAMKLTKAGRFGVSLDIIFEQGDVIGVDIWVNVRTGNSFEVEPTNHIACHSLESAYEELTFLEIKLKQ